VSLLADSAVETPQDTEIIALQRDAVGNDDTEGDGAASAQSWLSPVSDLEVNLREFYILASYSHFGGAQQILISDFYFLENQKW
jgi:hypothetical protein